ncbi:MAG: thermonuclease family protein [Myxococcales bacterium]|nr:thermonuclease family protein [Myxococcales bacterium]
MRSLFISVFLGTTLLFSPFQQASAEVSWQQLKKEWPLLWFMKAPCQVHKVVDGDTTHVHCNGKLEKLRLVGIDTPETKHPFKPVEYFGPEASARAKQLLHKGDNVILALQGRPGGRGRKGRQRGVYGRLLAYLFTTNGRMFNAQMVKEGYAFAMTRYPHTYMERFVRLEQEAKAARRGMWANPEKVTEMQAGDQQYRQLRRTCNRRLGRNRFDWVIGDSRTRYFFVKRHRAYFRTDYRTRRLFCSQDEARAAGFRQAPAGYRIPFDPGAHPKTSAGIQAPNNPSDSIGPRDVPPPPPQGGHHHHGHSSNAAPSGHRGFLILGNPKRKTFRILRSSQYRVFSSVQEAEAAGYRRVGKMPKGADNATSDASPSPRRRRRGKKGNGKFSRSLSALKERCNVDEPVVGNRRSKVYRTSSSRGYKRALKSKSKNTVFFCNEQEASSAGFRAAKR